MKCDKCGYDDKGTGDTAHVCVPENIIKMWADPRFQILADVIKLLEGGRVWIGSDWSYSNIHPAKYLPVRDRVREALDKVKAEYGVKE